MKKGGRAWSRPFPNSTGFVATSIVNRLQAYSVPKIHCVQRVLGLFDRAGPILVPQLPPNTSQSEKAYDASTLLAR
jgi:hypothetical protein